MKQKVRPHLVSRAGHLRPHSSQTGVVNNFSYRLMKSNDDGDVPVVIRVEIPSRNLGTLAEVATTTTTTITTAPSTSPPRATTTEPPPSPTENSPPINTNNDAADDGGDDDGPQFVPQRSPTENPNAARRQFVQPIQDKSPRMGSHHREPTSRRRSGRRSTKRKWTKRRAKWTYTSVA